MIIKAPFTDAQRDNLTEWQLSGAVHPFTCPNRSDGKHYPGSVLLPHKNGDGLVCESCDYIQDWAHDFMLNGDALIQHRNTIAKLRALKKNETD